MTAAEGQGFVMYVFMNGIISGADPLGVKFDGTYEPIANGHRARVTVSVPPGGQVIQGASAGPEGMTYVVELTLEERFWDQPYVEIQTPLGKVNAKFEQLRSLA